MADDNGATAKVDLARLAGSVHNYESFGRAVVAAALAEAAKSGNQGPLNATVTLTPVSHDAPTPPPVAAAKGVVPPTCYTVTLGFSDDSPTITVCY